MLKPVYRTASFLCQLVACLPIGTSLGLVHLLWAILSGGLLTSRGAVFPALGQTGLSDPETRRAEAALRTGKWSVSRLLARFGWMVYREHQAKPVRIGRIGYRPLLIDWVGFYRPHLHDCDSSHYSSEAGKALPALEFGMVASVQQIGDRRVPQLLALNRTGDTVALLRLAKTKQGQKDVIVADRQVKMSHIEEAQVDRFVIRGAQNLSARTSEIPGQKAGKRGRKPTHGTLVRPTPRQYRGKTLAATPPDREEQFTYHGRTLRVKWFDCLIVTGSTRIVSCLVIEDPNYRQPWILVTDLIQESAETIYRLYRSRWKIEQLPQTAKQLLGGQRTFVHGNECRYRLPEICLLAATLSLYLSATCEAVASGFWDRNPKPTPGRLRRVLAAATGQNLPQFRELPGGNGRVREKRAAHQHLTKGIEAHRRVPNLKSTHAVTGN